MKRYSVLHLFCGLGGGAIGFQRARARFRDLQGSFDTLAGIDNDPGACTDFESLTGAPALCADVAALQPDDIRRACGGRAPDVVFTSPPCKGFSGLLNSARLTEAKYQALNNLVFQGLWLVLETWPSSPPKLIVLENVPRIATRGAHLLRQLRELLARYGYRTHEGFHDCGEIGGLAQRRRRFLLVARHEAQVPTFVYQPPLRRVRSIGEVIGELPVPDDARGGPMHRLPRLQWKTWVRLALIPPGSDWRALGRKDEEPYRGSYGIVPWATPLGTVTGNGRPGAGAFSVADPRLPAGRYNNLYRVVDWSEPSVAITGGGTPTAGGVCVGDPRLGSPGSHESKFRVERWGDPAHTVTGSDRVGSGAPSVGDPRIGGKGSRPDLLGVLSWDAPAKTISGHASVSGSNCPVAVADPRLPDDEDRPDPPPVIVALDGTWHRPLTTLELAALQGLPVIGADGTPLVLSGNSHSAWRERIGNAVPAPAAQAVGEALLQSLLSAESGASFVLGGTGIWVRDLELAI